MPVNHFSDVHYAVLRLLTECGWVSPALLEVMGYSYTYRARTLKLLLDLQYIRKLGEGQARAYALAPKGRNHLAGFNASRFREEVMEYNRRLVHNVDDRSVLRGDAAAFFSIAGFAVHPDDKPAFPAAAPSLPEKPAREDWARLYQNARLIHYPDTQDRAVYTQRLTPLNCYYDAVQIKDLLLENGRDGASVRYSRVCGVLMTPSHLFRVYHSRDVAMKFHITGERNLQSLLGAGLAFRGYLPEEAGAALIFGSGFTSLLRVMEHHLAGHSARAQVYVKKKKGDGYAEMKGAIGERLTPGNLGDPAFFLPLERESLTLLRMMRYPFWQELLTREVCRELFRLENQPRWCFEHDGCSVYLLPSLCLQQMGITLKAIRLSPEKKFHIVCLDWQEPLFRELLEPLSAGRNIQVTALPTAYMESLQKRFDLYWGGGA